MKGPDGLPVVSGEETCVGCGQPLDVGQEHVTIEARYEMQDPPGHVVSIGGAWGLSYHREHAPTTEGVTAQIMGPEPGHVQVFARQADGTLVRWTARYEDAGLDTALGVLQILGDAWHREVTEPEVAGRPALITCPTCGSAQPHLHPSADLCPGPFHQPVPATLTEWRREVARWADLLEQLTGWRADALTRIAADMRREVRASGSGS